MVSPKYKFSKQSELCVDLTHQSMSTELKALMPINMGSVQDLILCNDFIVAMKFVDFYCFHEII